MPGTYTELPKIVEWACVHLKTIFHWFEHSELDCLYQLSYFLCPESCHWKDQWVKVVMNGTSFSPEKALQTALDQLRLDMPKASFDTWVLDVCFVSFEDGIFTISNNECLWP